MEGCSEGGRGRVQWGGQGKGGLVDVVAGNKFRRGRGRKTSRGRMKSEKEKAQGRIM